MASDLRGAPNSREPQLGVCAADRRSGLGCLARTGAGVRGCSYRPSWNIPVFHRMLVKALIAVGMALSVMPPALAMDDQGNYETSAFAALPQDQVTPIGKSNFLTSLLLAEDEPVLNYKSETSEPLGSTAEINRSETSTFQSILSWLTNSETVPQLPALMQSADSIIQSNGSQTAQLPPDERTLASEDIVAAVNSSASGSGLAINPILYDKAQSDPSVVLSLPSLLTSSVTSPMSNIPSKTDSLISSPLSSFPTLITTSVHPNQTITLDQANMTTSEVPSAANTISRNISFQAEIVSSTTQSVNMVTPSSNLATPVPNIFFTNTFPSNVTSGGLPVTNATMFTDAFQTDGSTLVLSTPDMASPLFPNESTSSINTRTSTSNPVSGSLMSSMPGVVNVSGNIHSSMESTTVASTLKVYNTNAPVSSAAYTIIESPNTLPDVFISSLSTDHEKMTTVSELSTSENVIRTSPEIAQNTPTVSSAPFTSTSGNFTSLDVSSRVSTSGLSSFVTTSSTVSSYGTTSNEVTGLHFTESANDFSVSPTTTVAPQLSSLTRNFETGTSNFITNIGDTINVTFTAENETKLPVSDSTITETNMFSFHSSAVTSNVNPSSGTLTVPTYVSSKSANTDMDIISTGIIWSNSTESQVPSTQSNVQPSSEVSSSTVIVSENTNITYNSLISTEIRSVTPEFTRFTGEYPNGSSVSSTPLPSRTTDVMSLNSTTTSSSVVTSARYENSTEMSQSHTNSTLPLTPFLNFTTIVTMNESTTFSGFVSTESAGINNQSDYSMSTESVNYSSSITSQQSTTFLTSSSDLHITNTTPTDQYENFTSFLPLNSTGSVSMNTSITFSSFYTTQISSTDNQTDYSVSTFTPSESINVSSSSTPQESTTFITSSSEKNGTNTTSIEQSEFTTSMPSSDITSPYTMSSTSVFTNQTAITNNETNYSTSTFTSSESINVSSPSTPQQSTAFMTSSSEKNGTNTTSVEQSEFTTSLPSSSYTMSSSSFFTNQTTVTNNETNYSTSTFTSSESINSSSPSTTQQSTTFMTSSSEKNGTNTTSVEQSEFTTSLPSSSYTMSSSSFFTNQTTVTNNETNYSTSTFTSSESIKSSSPSTTQQSTTFMTSSSEKNGTNTTSVEQSEFTTSLPSSSYTMSSSSFFTNQTTVTNNETNYSTSTFTSSESIKSSSPSTTQQSTTFMTSSSEKNGTNTTSVEQSEFTTSLPSSSYTMSSSSFFTNQTTVTNNETNYSTSTFTSSESINSSSPSTTQQSTTFMTSSSEKNGTNTTSVEQSEFTTSLPSSSYTMSSSSFFTNQTTVTNNETNYSTSTFTSSESINSSSPSTTQQSTTFMTSSEKNGTNTTSVEQSEFTTSLPSSHITSPYTMSSSSFFTNQTAATSNQTDNTTSTFTPSESLNFTSSSTQLPTFVTSSSEVNGTNSTPQTKTSHYFSTASNLTTNSSESTFTSTEVASSSVAQSFTSIANNQSVTSEISNTLHSFSSTVPSFSASTQISSFNTHSTEHAFTTSSHTLSTTLTSTNLMTTNSTHSLITEEKTTSAPSSTFTSKLSEGTSANNRTVAPTIMSSLTTKSTVTPTPFISTRTTLEVSTSHTLSSTTRRPTTTLTSTKHPTIVSTTKVDHNTVTVSSTEVATSTESSKTSSSPSITKTAALTSMITVPPQTTRGTATPLQNITESLISTTALPQVECNITERIWVKTVLSLNIRRSRASDVMNLNLTKGLTQALQKAFNDSHMLAQIESLQGVNNVTVGYYVRNDTTVYIASVVVDVLNNYGIDKMMSDIKQYVADVQSLPIPVAPWISTPALWAQLKTVLRFVGPTDNIQSCSFTQTMEERLKNAFEEAEATILNAHNILSVQILSTSQSIGSPAVSLIYVVWNQTKLLNGTVSSSLLNQLTAELVGYYLLFPPLIIAEPLEYQNLDTSSTTIDYWVITVIQDVSNTSLEENYQSFASLMEQRLAELFVNAQNQARRFRRATTVGSYTVQMVSIKRIAGPKNPAELTYYVLQNGTPLLGTTAAKILSTVDSQTMALTLGYFVQLQAEPVVKNPPNNLWIIAAVLAPIAVVTVIIIIITAVLCRKNKNDFKPDTMSNMHSRAKPVQGFDYAKQHLGQQGGEEDTIPVTQETVILPLPVRDMPLSQDRGILKDGSISKIAMSTELRKSRLPSEEDSVMSNESGKPISNRSSPQKVPMQQKMAKEDSKKKNGLTTNNRIVPKLDSEEGAILFERVSRSSYDAFDTSSGSLQLISIRPLAAPLSYSHPASERSQDSAVINGEVNKALKQKSDIEHYRNKLRLKAKRKGYYDFPAVDSGKKSITQKQKQAYEKAQAELDKVLNPEEDLSSTYVKSKTRQSQMKNPSYRSRQSLNSPSPGGTEMDLLVTREKPRRGIRNSGYDTEPELIEETNVDHFGGDPRGYTRSQQVKGHSETSTLSSQPSIDEVRQQMHMLLEEAFSLASAGQSTNTRTQGPYNPVQQLPYSEVVTSAPGTINRSRGAVQWVPAYGSDTYQYSLPRPAFRFSQLPDMAMGSSPPTVPPPAPARPTIITSLRRSTSDMGTKNRPSDHPGPEQQNPHDAASFVPIVRPPGPAVSVDQPISNYSGNPAPAVYAIPAARPGFTGYFIPTPPMYRGSAWMPYSTESDSSSQWAEAVPLPGYVEAYPHSRYQQNTPPRIPRQYSQTTALHPSLDQVPTPSTAASQQSLTENDTSEASLTNISTAALVKAIREEVAKLAKKQTDMFEFQV